MKYENATPSQKEAIMTTEERVLLLAGPGSGKTATVVARINLLAKQGVNLSEIVVLTFTNAAAREIGQRLAGAICGDDVYKTETRESRCPLGYCGTLHGFALRCLKEFAAAQGYGTRTAIVSPESAQELLLSKAKTLGSKSDLKKLLAIKAAGLPARGERMDVDQTVIASYYDELAEAGIVDFDVLLEEFYRILPEIADQLRQRHSYLFVDEVQDSALIDWNIYDLLPMQWKMYVGDPDQAIYGFRGGNVEEMLVRAKWPGTHIIKLEENFRSASSICETAQQLIEHAKNRIPKQTIATKANRGTVWIEAGQMNEGHEIATVTCAVKRLLETEDPAGKPPPNEIAILCRNNAIALDFQKTLAATGIPTNARERSTLPMDWSYARSVVELLVNPENDTLAFFYLIARGIHQGESTLLARTKAHAEMMKARQVGRSVNENCIGMVTGFKAADYLAGRGAVDFSKESRMLIAEILRTLPDSPSILDLALAMAATTDVTKEEKKEGVEVLTIHAAKGREWDNVFLVGFEDEVIPGNRKDANIEEERRLAYVAMTRARERLWITHSLCRVTPWGAIVQHHPSRFLEEATQ